MQKHIVVLDRYAPWKQFAVESDAQFVVYPSQRGGFSAQGVPVSQQDNTLRLPFPESWAGSLLRSCSDSAASPLCVFATTTAS